MKKSLLVAVSSAALLFASSAWADGGPEAEAPPPPPPVSEPEPSPVYEPEAAPAYKWYTTIFAGVVFGDHLEVSVEEEEDIFGDLLSLETGYLLGWTLGYDSLFGAGGFDLRPEVELSFRQQDVDLEGDLEDAGISLSTDVLSLLGNLWIDFEMNGVTPYIGGGAGIGWADLPFPSLFHLEASDFVWQFGGGLNFDVNERVFLGLGYRYFGGNFEADLTGTTFEYEYRAHEALANLGVRF